MVMALQSGNTHLPATGKTWTFVFILMLQVMGSFAQSYNFEKAMEALRQENYDEALDYFSRELIDKPKNSMALFYRSSIHYIKDNNISALNDINEALKNFDKKNKVSIAGAHGMKAKIYLGISEKEKAVSEYTAAIRYNPENVSYYVSRGRIYFQMGQLDDSKKDYLKAIEMEESNVEALTYLGLNYIEEKNLEEAGKLLNLAVKLDPDFADAYYYRAMMYFEQKKYNDAISDAFNSYVLDESDNSNRSLFINYAPKNIGFALAKVNAVLNANPDQEKWYFLRAQLYESQTDLQAAIADYSRILEISDPATRGVILRYRALCYLNADLIDRAFTDYNSLIELDSTDAPDYLGRGEVKILKADYAGALEDFSKAISVMPEFSWSYFKRGRLKELYLNDFDGALNDYESAISLAEDGLQYYLYRGCLYMRKFKDTGKARADFEKILSADTSLKNSKNYRQYALYYLSRTGESIAWQSQLLEQDSSAENYYNAACLYSLMGKKPESVAFLRKAFENGYRSFNDLKNDQYLDNVRDNPEFITLMSEKQKKFMVAKDLQVAEPAPDTVETYKTATIPMKSRGSGTFEVSCKVNGLLLNFIFDTGASDISISQTEAFFMLKNGYLSESDIKGEEKYIDATGNISVGTKILLKKVEIGGLILQNVSASVVNNKKAPLLLGQSALSKYGKILIDNKKGELTITVPENKGN
jgi:clan AA aspartic protease (TIGR02281 family)